MKKRLLIFTLIVTILVISLASCGGAAKGEALMRDDMAEVNGLYAAPMEEAEIAYNSKYGFEDSVALDKSESSTAGGMNESYSEKIIKNVSISAQTKEYDTALNGILTSLSAHGGYEESVNSSGRGYYAGEYYTRTARLTVRVPAENLDAFLGEIGGMINVTNQSSNKANVTAAYYDLKARLEVLEAERQAYEEMLKMAKDVGEVLQIKDRLYNTIEEIEANKTQLNIYDNKVSYSTVHITLDEVKDYVEVPTPKTTFGQRIANAFKESWIGFSNGFQNFIVWLVAVFPTLLVLTVFIGGAITAGIVIYKKKKRNN